MRAIDWVSESAPNPSWIRLLDQTRLPNDEIVLEIRTVDQLIDAISRLAVRGAPALGVAGAMGAALALQNGSAETATEEIARLREARPTAVNLAWGVDRVMRSFDQGFDAVLTEAIAVRDEDILGSQRMAEKGYNLLAELLPEKINEGLTLMTICNTGSLAAVEGGTALGVIAEVFRRGDLTNVIACETRPLFQGARLTAWELAKMGAPHQTVVDSAANFITSQGGIDAILVGADRIAANGDSANKIGTFSIALGAQYAGIPFIVVAPESTIDVETASGDLITIEDRGTDEVVTINGKRMSPAETTSLNPAFDVTPAALITGIVTDARVIRPALGQQPADAL
ncbi:S-methyl-5-thioribose-1-phosphate isomerase [Lysinibacter cavernae]|uniref:Methylthioribose-1-phosphate isomerase n=1 Tax=Lysinibacter cavernae TaxID=1640652 RepID=A0A7X5R1E4_9MICO|nr:methylthioribose-1-phosphate isomerase [Lysinibacter cavernae]